MMNKDAKTGCNLSLIAFIHSKGLYLSDTLQLWKEAS